MPCVVIPDTGLISTFLPKTYQCKNCKKYGHFTCKCFNLSIKRKQANLCLVDAKEVDHLQSFSQSLSTIQSFIADCSSASDTSDTYSDYNDCLHMKSRSRLLQAYPKQDFMQI